MDEFIEETFNQISFFRSVFAIIAWTFSTGHGEIASGEFKDMIYSGRFIQEKLLNYNCCH